jgi:hypothetical protein
MSIKDRIGCALLQQALSCVLTHTRFMGSRKLSSLTVIELDDTLPCFTGVYWDSVCDRTTSKMRGLSPKIISGDSRRRENVQTHANNHTIPNMKFKLKLLQIKCHVLGFTKDKAQNVLQKIIRVCGSIRLSR